MRRHLIALTVGLATPLAAADTISAKDHFELGKKHYTEQEYDLAVKEYLEAYKQQPLAELVFDIAQAYRLAGNKAEALKYYDLFLHDAPNGPLVEEAREQQLKLRAEMTEEASAAKKQATVDAWAQLQSDVKARDDAERLHDDVDRRYVVGGVTKRSIGGIKDGNGQGWTLSGGAEYHWTAGRIFSLAMRARAGLVLGAGNASSFVEHLPDGTEVHDGIQSYNAVFLALEPRAVLTAGNIAFGIGPSVNLAGTFGCDAMTPAGSRNTDLSCPDDGLGVSLVGIDASVALPDQGLRLMLVSYLPLRQHDETFELGLEVGYMF